MTQGLDQYQIDQYQIGARLGRGGTATVYRAVDRDLGRSVAIKLQHRYLVDAPDVCECFRDEARALSSIDDAGTVAIYDFGVADDGSAFIVMEHLEGETVDDLLERCGGTLEVDRAARIIALAARALAAVHERDIIHCDIKPENVFLAREQWDGLPAGRVVLIDFGIARHPRATFRPAPGQTIGTPMYMAPEQIIDGGRVDPRADIYALGCVAFEMLCGRPPFVGDELADVFTGHIQHEPPSPRELVGAHVPRWLDELVQAMLAKSPDDRPPDASSVLLYIDRRRARDSEVLSTTPAATTVHLAEARHA